MMNQLLPRSCNDVRGTEGLTNCGDAHRRRPCCSGFTLIELILTVGIIIILMALDLNTVSDARKKAARVRAETEIAAMSAALQSYNADNAVYPAGTGAHALYQALSGDGNNAIGGSTASTGTP